MHMQQAARASWAEVDLSSSAMRSCSEERFCSVLPRLSLRSGGNRYHRDRRDSALYPAMCLLPRSRAFINQQQSTPTTRRSWSRRPTSGPVLCLALIWSSQTMAVTSGDTMVQLASSASFIGERGSMFWAVPESLRPTCHSSVQLYLYAGKNKLPQTVVDAISASDRRLRNHDGQLNSRRLMKPSTTAPSGEEAEEERKESLPTTMLPRNLINAFPFSERRVALWVEAEGVFKCLEWPAEQAGDETGYPRRLDPG